MSAVLDLARMRRTRRFPWDETLSDGTPATQVLLPRRLRMPVEGEGVLPPPVDLQPQPDGSFSLDAPPRQVFSEGTPAPALQAPTNLRRTLAFTPPVAEMPSEALAPLPAEAVLAQRRFTKPSFQSTGDQAGDLTRYEQGLSEWRNPGDKNGRLKSFGLGALRGLMRGLATGGGLGAGIGGAVAGGVHGAVAPNADERAWRDEEIARTQQQRGALEARRFGALKLRGMEAQIGLDEANAEKARRAPAVQPDVQIIKGRGGYYAVDKNNVNAQPVRLPIDPDEPDKPPTMFNWMGQRMTIVPNGQGGWKAEPLPGVPVDASEVPVKEDGLMVKPGTALSARATREQRQYQRGRDAKQDARQEAGERNAQAQQEWKDYSEARARQEQSVKAYNAAAAAYDKAYREALADVEDAEKQARAADALRVMEGLAPDVSDEHAYMGADRRYHLKEQKQRPALATPGSRQPASRRRGADPLGLFN